MCSKISCSFDFEEGKDVFFTTSEEPLMVVGLEREVRGGDEGSPGLSAKEDRDRKREILRPAKRGSE